MNKFKELHEARVKKIKLKDLPKTILGGKYDDGKAHFYDYSKTKGSYEYSQIESDENGDYGDEGEKYNQGYTLDCEVEIIDGKINLTSKVTDLGAASHNSFGKKYSNLEFDNLPEFIKQIQKIIKEFDKL